MLKYFLKYNIKKAAVAILILNMALSAFFPDSMIGMSVHGEVFSDDDINSGDNEEKGIEEGNPDEGGEEGNPDEGGEEGNPDEGGEEGNPDEGGEEGNPDEGGEEGNPDEGGEEGNPDEGGEEGNPDEGGGEENPDEGGEESFESITDLLPDLSELLFPPDFPVTLDIAPELPNSMELESYEAIVKTDTELRAALASDEITMIYFGEDIEMTTSTLTDVSPRKTSLIIDGKNPETGEIHTYTEYNSESMEHMFILSSRLNLTEMTFQNLNIVGYNHYGVITVRMTAVGIRQNYINITYKGPQITWNPYGIAYYENAELEIIGGTGYPSGPGEVAEASQVIVAGDFKATQLTENGNDIFYLYGHADVPASLDIMPGANVDIYCYTDSGFVFAGNRFPFKMGKGAVMTYSARNRFNRNLACSSFYIDEDASLEINIRENITVDIIVVYGGDFVMEKGSSLHVYGKSASSNHLIMLRNGAKAYFNDPDSVILYHKGGRTITADGLRAPIYIETQQVNVWNGETTAGFENQPLHHWRKTNENNLEFTADITVGNFGGFTNIETNHAIGDIGGELTAANFNLETTRVLSMGRMDVYTFYRVINGKGRIIGNSRPNSELRAYYELEGEKIYIAENVFADAYGDFEIILPEILDESTNIVVEAYSDYLYWQSSLFPAEGILMFTKVTPSIEYEDAFIGADHILLSKDEDMEISVLDTRGIGSRWILTGKVLRNFHSSRGDINSQMAFIDKEGYERPFEENRELLIAEHTTQSNSDKITLNYDAGEGLTAIIYFDMPVYADTEYSTAVQWILYDTP